MDEVSDIVKVVACIDELPNIIWKAGNGISRNTWDRILAFTGAEDPDAVCVVAGAQCDVETAMKEIRDRVRLAVEKGVPDETRRQVRGGSTRFERVLPGPDRMYPDTDLPPLSITAERIEKIRKNTPDFVWNRKARYREMGLSEVLISEILTLGIADKFDKLTMQKPPFSASFLAHLLTGTLKSLRRRGIPVDKLGVDAFENMMDAVRKGYFAKEGAKKALEYLAKHPDTRTDELPAAIGIHSLEEENLPELITRTLEANEPKHCNGDKDCRYRFMMGELMREIRGRLDGEKVSEMMIKSL